jgi:hypothetical protein
VRSKTAALSIPATWGRHCTYSTPVHPRLSEHGAGISGVGRSSQIPYEISNDGLLLGWVKVLKKSIVTNLVRNLARTSDTTDSSPMLATI